MMQCLQKSKRLPLVLLTLLGCYSIYRFGWDAVKPPGGLIPNDYVVLYKAFHKFQLGQTFYHAEDTSPFKYSPTFLILYGFLFGHVPLQISWFLWCLVSIVGFLGCTWHLWHQYGFFESIKPTRFALAAGSCLIFSWHGFIEHLTYGQGDFILFTLFFSFVFLIEKHNWVAALLISILLLMKPQAVILLSYPLLTNRWLVLRNILLLTIVLFLAPVIILGLGNYTQLLLQWISVLSKQTPEFLTGNLNQSLASVTARLLSKRQWIGPLSIGFMFLIIPIVLRRCIGYANLKWYSLPGRKWPGTWAKVNDYLFDLLVFILYTLFNPLAWRWLTFCWFPLGTVLFLQINPKQPWLKKILILFSLNGIFLQSIVAEKFGIHEMDILSFYGLYALGNLLLGLGFLLITSPSSLKLANNSQ